MYGKNVTNAEAILELPNLVNLELSDCKTPDKKKLMTRELKKKFVERGFKKVWQYRSLYFSKYKAALNFLI